jgi:magnesium chelatase family protein
MVTNFNAIALAGIEGFSVDVEVDLHSGLPAFHIIGLPDKALQEAVHRVSSAIRNSGYKFPMGKIIVNLAPANLLKSGTAFDFSIALGILAASKQISMDMRRTAFWGELSLDGSAKFTKGTLAAICVAKDLGYTRIIIPGLNACEAGIVAGINIGSVRDLKQLASDTDRYDKVIYKDFKEYRVSTGQNTGTPEEDFCRIRGQSAAKRALEISATGGHNLIMSGPPGSGKTLLSQAYNSILPPLEMNEALEVTKLYSVAGLLSKDQQIMFSRPFRSPHHTSSKTSLVGGGYNLKPGEISLAHHGVLFLDEMNEFSTDSLDVLRQPLENKKVTVARAAGSVCYPANFTLLAAVNPCKCGYYLDKKHQCTCVPKDIQNYRNKISGPVLDRIDLLVYVSSMPGELLNIDNIEKHKEIESSGEVKKRVIHGRMIQKDRSMQRFGIPLLNSGLNLEQILATTKFSGQLQTTAGLALEKFDLTTRGLIRVLRVARTIADLAGSENILENHFMESLGYRLTNI